MRDLFYVIWLKSMEPIFILALFLVFLKCHTNRKILEMEVQEVNSSVGVPTMSLNRPLNLKGFHSLNL